MAAVAEWIYPILAVKCGEDLAPFPIDQGQRRTGHDEARTAFDVFSEYTRRLVLVPGSARFEQRAVFALRTTILVPTIKCEAHVTVQQQMKASNQS